MMAAWRAQRSFLVLLAGVLGLAAAAPSLADEIRPALLDIKERGPGLFVVTWKVPTRGDRVLKLTPRLPASLELVGSPAAQLVPGARVERATYKSRTGSLTGETISIEGLAAIQTDVLLLLQLGGDRQFSAILRPSSPSFEIPSQPSSWKIAADYVQMGTIHILEGVDHLLFVLALLLIVDGLGPLLKAITAFTVAHSITLALATLQVIRLPSAPTEAVISLSILFLAAEIAHKQEGRVGWTERWPWLVAFAFGLFHGLGFAGALSEIGVPQGQVPLALLTFNIGVELGQILFVTTVLAALVVFRHLPITPPASARRLAPYAIGGVAAFWTIERVGSFLPT